MASEKLQTEEAGPRLSTTSQGSNRFSYGRSSLSMKEWMSHDFTQDELLEELNANSRGVVIPSSLRKQAAIAQHFSMRLPTYNGPNPFAKVLELTWYEWWKVAFHVLSGLLFLKIMPSIIVT